MEVTDRIVIKVCEVKPGLTAHTGCCSRIYPSIPKTIHVILTKILSQSFNTSITPSVYSPVSVFGTTWLRHLCNKRREGEIETKWDILNVNMLMGIQIQTERYSRRQCTAEQTNQRVNNRTRGQAKQREECCFGFVWKKKRKYNLTTPPPLKMLQIRAIFTAHQMFFFLKLESNNRVILPSCLTEIYITRKILPNTSCLTHDSDWFISGCW